VSSLNGLSWNGHERYGTSRLHLGGALHQSICIARAQQPRQMFPIARSTAASSGVGLSMASGTEDTPADVGC
jgi:hypothetical protein